MVKKEKIGNCIKNGVQYIKIPYWVIWISMVGAWGEQNDKNILLCEIRNEIILAIEISSFKSMRDMQ